MPSSVCTLPGHASLYHFLLPPSGCRDTHMGHSNHPGIPSFTQMILRSLISAPQPSAVHPSNGQSALPPADGSLGLYLKSSARPKPS